MEAACISVVATHPGMVEECRTGTGGNSVTSFSWAETATTRKVASGRGRALHNTSTCAGGSINSIYDDLFQTSRLNELT